MSLRTRLILGVTLAGLLIGSIAWLLGYRSIADWCWAMGTAVTVLPLVASLVNGLRKGQVGVDVIAFLALTLSLGFRQFLAGSLIALMFATGRALEDYAGSRARRELSNLVARAPRTVSRYVDGRVETVPISEVSVGDLLLVRPGEVIPVDGVVESAFAVLDESALTGESTPVEHAAGQKVASGTVNGGVAFDMQASTTAEASTYAAVVRLAREAEKQKAPFVRLADRYSVVFLPLTLAVAGAAWLISGDPIRGLAVLVVATPCPLILAAPVAIVAGLSRAAGRGIIVKGGGALEMLGQASILLFDKTGTLTRGRPELVGIERLGPAAEDEVLRFAASLDQASTHVLASSLIEAAQQRRLRLTAPSGVVEQAGSGIAGTLDGHKVAVGKAAWAAGSGQLPGAVQELRRRAESESKTTVFVGIDGRLAGCLLLQDPVREDAAVTLRDLREAGIRRMVMVTGDNEPAARLAAGSLPLDVILSGQSPLQKIEAVRAERERGVAVMVGDGINDAPALATADVGVAMGARGATASSEAADVVLMVDRLDRLTEAISIARRSRGIAVQSVFVGMALSLIAMGIAALGFIPPAPGALLQEGIDVAVILNALRALGAYPTPNSERSRSVGAREQAA